VTCIQEMPGANLAVVLSWPECFRVFTYKQFENRQIKICIGK
jgi:hypothetical protein